MAKLVTKFKYLNSNRDNNIGGYAKYIATREGVERIDDTKKISPATKKQQQFIEKIVRDFPDSKEMLEYEDYRKEQTVGNASEFISRALEDNAWEVMNTKTYADYIATRPRAERFGTHGLFTDEGVQVKLNKVSEELNLHEGNVWTIIISLRREDAERLGYNNGIRWRDMLRTQTEALATNLKIPMENLRWFAAFHNESHHPHVHLMAYSTTINEGYLTKQGVHNLRSAFARDIFAQDLLCVYEKQTEHRNELRSQSRELIAEIIFKISLNDYDNPKMEEMLVKLADRLFKTKGKKVYGYLKADVKNMIDAIVEELEKDERIAKLYELWYEQREEVLRTYTEEMPKRVPLSQNKEFKSIKNTVIKEAMKIATEKDYIKETEGDGIEEKLEKEMGTIDENIELIEEDIPNVSAKNVSGKKKEKKTWWTDAYKMARKLLYGTKETPPDFKKALPLLITEAEKGNGFAMYDFGKMFLSGLGCEKSEEEAQKWFEKAYHAFIKEESRAEKPGYLRYRIGKLYSFGYGVEQDYMKAAEWYEKAVAENNPFAAYALGSLYLKGQGVEKNEEKAFELFIVAAMDEKKPNAYAQYELGKMCKEGTGTPVDIGASDKWYRKAYNGFLSIEQNMADDKLYYRLGQMNYTGTGTERDFEKVLIYFEKALQLRNVNAMYGLGKLYLNKDFQKRDIKKAVYYLTEAANQGNLYAERLLEIIRNNYNRYIAGGTLSLFQSIGRMIRNRIEDENREGKGNIDRKLKRKIDEKKQAHGLHQG